MPCTLGVIANVEKIRFRDARRLFLFLGCRVLWGDSFCIAEYVGFVEVRRGPGSCFRISPPNQHLEPESATLG